MATGNADVDLAGTRVLVTGGTSGLGGAVAQALRGPGPGGARGGGREMAQALVDAGAHVALTSRERSRADAVAAELGERAAGLALDGRDERSVEAAVDRVHARLGGLDMLVNNAGIGMRTVN